MYCPNCGEELRCDCSNCAPKNEGLTTERILKQSDVPASLGDLISYGVIQCGKCEFAQTMSWWDNIEYDIVKSMGYWAAKPSNPPLEVVRDFNLRHKPSDAMSVCSAITQMRVECRLESPAYVLLGIPVIKVNVGGAILTVELERITDVEQETASTQTMRK